MEHKIHPGALSYLGSHNFDSIENLSKLKYNDEEITKRDSIRNRLVNTGSGLIF